MLETMRDALHIPVINAMTDENHPCEMMSDLYSLSKIRENYLKDQYLFVGADGNIGRAWREAAEAFGLSLVQSCREKYAVDGVENISNLREAIVGRDVVCTDSIPASYLNDFNDHQITEEMMDLANPGAVLNPCPPFYRGEEVSEDVVDSDYFVGYDFKKSLLRVQQAIMIYCLAR